MTDPDEHRRRGPRNLAERAERNRNESNRMEPNRIESKRKEPLVYWQLVLI